MYSYVSAGFTATYIDAKNINAYRVSLSFQTRITWTILLHLLEAFNRANFVKIVSPVFELSTIRKKKKKNVFHRRFQTLWSTSLWFETVFNKYLRHLYTNFRQNRLTAAKVVRLIPSKVIHVELNVSMKFQTFLTPTIFVQIEPNSNPKLFSIRSINRTNFVKIEPLVFELSTIRQKNVFHRRFETRWSISLKFDTEIQDDSRHLLCQISSKSVQWFRSCSTITDRARPSSEYHRLDSILYVNTFDVESEIQSFLRLEAKGCIGFEERETKGDEGGLALCCCTYEN